MTESHLSKATNLQTATSQKGVYCASFHGNLVTFSREAILKIASGDRFTMFDFISFHIYIVEGYDCNLCNHHRKLLDRL